MDCRLDIRLKVIPHIAELHHSIMKAGEDCVPKLDEAFAEFRDKLKNW